MTAAPALLLVAAGCMGMGDGGSMMQGASDPIETDPDAGPPEACGFDALADDDPAEGTVSVTLRASSFAWDPGTGVPLDDGLAFEGQVPGPVIEANLGERLEVRFENDTGVDLTLHWHGLRVPPDMDGVAQMDDPVAPGESFVYSFDLLDSGFYWVHPHVDTAGTIEAGLYAPVVVHAPGEPEVGCDLPLVLDDVLLDDDTLQIVPGSTGAMSSMIDRLGNLLLANGRAGRRYAVTGGEWILLRLLNAANARYFDVYLEEHSMIVVGTDGGFVGSPTAVDHLVLAPGERYLVAVRASGEPGRSYDLLTRPVALMTDEGMGGMMGDSDPFGDDDYPVASFVYEADDVATTTWLQPDAEPPPWGAPVSNYGHGWELGFSMSEGYTIDGATFPDVPALSLSAGVATSFDIANTSDMHHPFHVHGQRFEVVAIDGVASTSPATLGWKDTVDVAPGTTVSIVSALDNPGDWLYHCHILEHAEAGMAGVVTLE